MYLTYAEYQTYGGTLDETTFNDLGFEACCIVDWYTFRRLVNDTEVSENVKRLVYRLINELNLRNQAMTLGRDTSATVTETPTNTGVVQSQSNDGFSVQFNVMSAKDIAASSTLRSPQMRNLIETYLTGVRNALGQDVLYRGLYPNE